MNFKNYLAAFFIMVFLGKMVTIDARFLGIIFDTSEVMLVNKLCPKKQLHQDTSQKFATDNVTPSFEIDYLCNVVFDIQVDDSSEALPENNFKKYSYRAPGNFSIPGDKFYPPPKA